MTDVLQIEETQILGVEVEVTEVISEAEQGPPGPPGAPGAAGGQVLQRTAGEGTSALLAVYEDLSGAVWPADADAESDVLALLGVTVTAAQANQPIQVQRVGVIDDGSWQWQAGQRIFLSQEGRLTQQAPLSGYDVLIGVALTATRVLLNIQDPIELE